MCLKSYKEEIFVEKSQQLNLPDGQECLDVINKHGFVILKNCVSQSFIDSQRVRWSNRFVKGNIQRKFVRGNLILGESNFLSYSAISAWCMYRYIEFLWNDSEDDVATKLHVDLHKYRNRIHALTKIMGLTTTKQITEYIFQQVSTHQVKVC